MGTIAFISNVTVGRQTVCLIGARTRRVADKWSIGCKCCLSFVGQLAAALPFRFAATASVAAFAPADTGLRSRSVARDPW